MELEAGDAGLLANEALPDLVPKSVIRVKDCLCVIQRGEYVIGGFKDGSVKTFHMEDSLTCVDMGGERGAHSMYESHSRSRLSQSSSCVAKEPLCSVKAFSYPVTELIDDPESGLLWAVDKAGYVGLFNAEDPTQLTSDPVTHRAVVPKDKTKGVRSTLPLHAMATHGCVVKTKAEAWFAGDGGDIRSVRVTRSAEGSAPSFKLHRVLKGHTGLVVGLVPVDVAMEGGERERQIWSAGSDGKLCQRDLNDGHVMKATTMSAACVALDTYRCDTDLGAHGYVDTVLVVALDNGTIQIINPATHESLTTVTVETDTKNAIRTMAVSDQEVGAVMVGTSDGYLRMLTIQDVCNPGWFGKVKVGTPVLDCVLQSLDVDGVDTVAEALGGGEEEGQDGEDEDGILGAVTEANKMAKIVMATRRGIMFLDYSRVTERAQEESKMHAATTETDEEGYSTPRMGVSAGTVHTGVWDPRTGGVVPILATPGTERFLPTYGEAVEPVVQVTPYGAGGAMTPGWTGDDQPQSQDGESADMIAELIARIQDGDAKIAQQHEALEEKDAEIEDALTRNDQLQAELEQYSEILNRTSATVPEEGMDAAAFWCDKFQASEMNAVSLCSELDEKDVEIFNLKQSVESVSEELAKSLDVLNNKVDEQEEEMECGVHPSQANQYIIDLELELKETQAKLAAARVAQDQAVGKVHDWKKRRDTLQEVEDSIHRQMTMAKAEAEAKTESLNDTRAELEATTDGLAKCQADLDQACATIEDLNTQYTQLETDYNSTCDAFEEQKTMYEEVLQDLESHAEAVGEVSAERDSLVAALQAKEGLMATLEAERDSLLHDKDDMGGESAALANRVSALTAEVETLGAERDALTAARDGVEAALSEAKEQCQTLQTDLETEREAAGTLRAEAEASTSQVSGLQAQVEALSAERDAAASDAATHTDRCSALEAQLEGVRGEVQAAVAAKDALLAESSSGQEAMVEELATLRAKIDTLVQEGETLAAERDAAVAEAEGVRAVVAEREAALTQAQEALAALTAEGERERDTEREKLAEMSQYADTLAATHASLQSDHTTLKAAHAEVTATLQDRETHITTTEATLAEVQAAHTALEAERDRVSAAHSSVTQDLEALTATHASVSAEAQAVGERHAALEETLATVRQELAEAIAARDGSAAQVEEREREMETVQVSLAEERERVTVLEQERASQLEASTASLAQGKAALESVETEVDALKMSVTSLEAAKAALIGERDEVAAQGDALSASLTEAQTQVEALTEERDSLAQERQALSARLEERAGAVSRLEASVATLGEDKAGLEAVIGNMNLEVLDGKQALGEIRAEMEKAVASGIESQQALQAEVDRVTGELEESRADGAKVGAAMLAVNAELEAAKGKVTQLETEAKGLNEEIASVSEAKAEAEAALQAANASLSEAQIDYADMETETGARISELEARVQTQAQEAEALTATIKGLEETMQAKEAEAATVRTDLEQTQKSLANEQRTVTALKGITEHIKNSNQASVKAYTTQLEE
ncbi:hypothetical protein KIPB_006999, partial [Kipferlia bialata]|eukprot:g6999.t1